MTNTVHTGNKKGGLKGSAPTAATSAVVSKAKEEQGKKPATCNKPFIILPQLNKPLKKSVIITTPAASTSSQAPAGSTTSPTAAVSTASSVPKKNVPATANKTENAINGKNKNEKQPTAPSTTVTAKTSESSSTPSFQPPQFQKKKNQWWKLPKQPSQQQPPKHNNNAKPQDAGGAAQMLVSPETPWYDQFPNAFGKAMKTTATTNTTTNNKIDEKTIHEMEEAAKLAYQKEIDCYRQELMKLGISTDQKWLSSVINSGTWSDKIAALALRVQESPFHNLEAFDLLLGIALKKDMRSGFMAIDAIKDLLTNNLLPENRPLRDFTAYSQALYVTEMTSMQVPMLCWFENQLKTKIGQLLTVIDNALKANITHFRHQGMDVCLELLSKRQEQETRILSMVVNKMGDSDGKISSKACELLKTLLKRRPLLKSAVIREVRIFIYRPNTKLTAIFTAVNFLGQIHLSATASHHQNATKQDRALALQLAECYLSLFEKAIAAKEEGSRLLTALLNGINKVFPFLSDNDKNHSSLLPYMDQIFRLVHTANSFATSTQALALIAHMVFANNAEIEKNKQNGKEGEEEEEKEKVTTTSADEERANSVRNRYYVTLYSKLLSTQSFQHAKNTLFLNLIYKSVKYDPNLHRAKAFVKRIAICATECAPAMTAGLLFMISEIMKARPQLKKMLSAVDPLPAGVQKMIDDASNQSAEDHGDEEDGSDNSSDDDASDDSESEDASKKGKTTTASISTEQAEDMLGYFHMNKRNPLYAVEPNQTPSLYELSLLRHHFHPSVKAFADALCEGPQHAIAFSGDPLTEFNLISFLNRFAYKNPKQKFAESLKRNRMNVMGGQDELPVNQMFTTGEEIDESKIAPEKHFFYKFFGEREALRAMGKSKDRKKKRSKDDDDEEEDSSADEEEMDRYADKLADDMMKHDAATRGEEFGDDDEDDDGDFDEDGEFDDMDFDEDDDEEDEEDDDDSELVGKKNNKKADNKKSKKGSDSMLDFEDFKKQQQESKANKKGKKNAKFVEDEEDDDDFDHDFGADEAEDNSDDEEGDFEEPEAYVDSDEEDEGDEMEEIEMSDVEEFDDEDDEDDDFPMMLEEDDDEEEEEPVLTKKGKGKNDKKDQKKEKSKKNGKKNKRSRDDDDEDDGMDDGDDVFGSAEDYEEEMEKIINTFKAEAPATKIARAMKEGKNNSKNQDSMKQQQSQHHQENKKSHHGGKGKNHKKRKTH